MKRRRFLWFLPIAALAAIIGLHSLTTDAAIQDWSINAGSNSSAAPNGFPEGMAPSGVNDSARELMAQVRRWAEQKISGQFATGAATGPNTYQMSPAIPITGAMTRGAVYWFQAVTTNTGPATLNVSAISAYDIQLSGAALAAGNITNNKWIEVVFDGTHFQILTRSDDSFVDPTTTRGDLIQRGASALARLPLGALSQVASNNGTDVTWSSISGVLDAITSAQGAILHRGSSTWQALAPGTNLQLLQTQGAAANPQWSTAGLVLQQAYSAVTGFSTTTTVMPTDNSLPQSGEGAQVLTVSITPRASTNILEIECQIHASFSVAGTFLTIALFQNTDANAIAVGMAEPRDATGLATIPLFHRMVALTTAAQTFKIRGGGHQAGTTTFNGQSGAQVFSNGGTNAITYSNCRVHELSP